MHTLSAEDSACGDLVGSGVGSGVVLFCVLQRTDTVSVMTLTLPPRSLIVSDVCFLREGDAVSHGRASATATAAIPRAERAHRLRLLANGDGGTLAGCIQPAPPVAGPADLHAGEVLAKVRGVHPERPVVDAWRARGGGAVARLNIRAL